MKGKNYVDPFIFENGCLSLSTEVFEELHKCNATDLFEEHIELFEHLSNCESYQMKPFDLVTKGEFLFNAGASNCYMHMQGELVDREQKVVYGIVNVTQKEHQHDNYIIDNNKIVYHTKNCETKQGAIDKINELIDGGFEFKLCAKFPHLGYCNTAYFNLGKVNVVKVSAINENTAYDKEKQPINKYNHEITLELETKIPVELLQYKL